MFRSLFIAVLACGVSLGALWAATPETASAPVPATATATAAASVWKTMFPDGLMDAAGAAYDPAKLEGKIVGIYFSAHWCPPCQGFTPKLVAFRDRYSTAFEVVFVSSDRSAEAQKAYMAETNMKWPATAWRSAPGAALSRRFEVQGIPTLVILGPDGKEITREGRADVTAEPDKALAKWQAKAGVATTAPAEGAAAPADVGPYAAMVEALGLSPEQRRAVASRYDRQRQAQAAFLQQHRQAWAAAMEAAAATDPAAAQAGKAQVQAFQQQFAALTGEHQLAVMGALTREQALAWDEQALTDQIAATFRTVTVGHGAGGELVAQASALGEPVMKAIRTHAAALARTMQGWPNPYEPARRAEAIAATRARLADELAKAGLTPAGPQEQ